MRLSKKFGAVALATVVATTTVMPAFAAETLTGTAWWTGMQAGVDYAVKDGETTTLIVKCKETVDDYAAFNAEIYADGWFFTTGSDLNAWWAEGAKDGDEYYADSTITGVASEFASTITEGTYYIDVARKGTTLTVTYYDSNRKVYNEFVGSNPSSMPKDLKVHILAQVGTYEVSQCTHKNLDIKKATCTTDGKEVCKDCKKVISETKATGHKFDKVVKATTKANGSTGDCSVCDAKGGVVYAIKDATLKTTSYTYSGKAKKPSVVVKDTKGKAIPSTYYTVSYKNNVKAGKGTVTVTFKGIYDGKLTKTFTIKKASQKISKYVTTKSVKYSSVKKKAQTFKIGAKAKTSVTYSTVRKDSKKKVSVSRTGNVTVKKGTKKGTYTVKVKASTKGNSNYKSASKTFTLKVKVK